ncbi:MAG: hypothetical protein ABJA71_08290, partial [Ginsengibacter sp.]
NQYEQHCNAAALDQMNVDVLKSLNKKYLSQISGWIKSSKIIAVDYPDITCGIINMIVEEHANSVTVSKKGAIISPLKDCKEYSLENIILRKANYDANETGGVW